jgi:hypothetical protein
MEYGCLAYLDKVFENVRAELCVVDFWMELKAEAIHFAILHSLDLAGLAKCCYFEARRCFGDLVIVTLPDRLFGRSSLEKWSTMSN